MTIPKVSNKHSSSQPTLSCVNCGDNFGDNSRVVHAFQSFINNAPARIFVEAAIKEIYRLNDQPDFKFQDGCVLCVHCCLLLSQMFGLFRLFEARQNPEGLLASCCSGFRNPALTGNENFIEVEVTEKAGGEGLGQVSFLAVDDEDDKFEGSSEEVEEHLDQTSVNVDVDSDNSPAHLDDENDDEDGSLNGGPDDVEESEDLNAEALCLRDAEQDDPIVSKIHPDGKQIIFQCADCSKSFKQAFQLRTHRVSVHNSGEAYKCAVCKNVYSSATTFRQHLFNHCRVARNKFNITCSMCDRNFPNQSALVKHKSLMHSFEPKKKLKKIMKPEKIEGAKCQTCNETFDNVIVLRKHRLAVHSNTRPSTSRDLAKLQSCLQLSSDVETGKGATGSDEGAHGQESVDSDYDRRVGLSSSERAEDEASKHRSKKHLPSGPLEDALSCSDWSKQYLNRGSFTKHRKTKHRGSPTYQCHICQSIFTGARSLILHIRNHNFNSQSQQITFQCVDCKLKYDSVTAYEKHRKDDHGDVERPFKCPVAYKDGDLFQKTRRNIQSVNNRKVLKCSKLYRAQGRLNEHLETHQKTIFACNICDANFLYAWDLKRHVTYEHVQQPAVAPDDDPPSSQDNSDVEDIQINQDPTTRLFSCPQCFREFVTQRACRFHLESVHPELMCVQCEICNKKFNSMNSLKVHRRIHQAAESEHYDYASNSLNVQQHAKRAHQPAINEKKRLDSKAERLTKEVSRKPALFKCADCDQSFQTNSLLVTHRTTDHPEHEKLKCPHCLKVLPIAKKLRVHIRRHDEGKDWPCGECSMRFLERLPRDLHLEEAHGIQKAQDDWMPLPRATTLQHLSGEFSETEKTMAGATTTTKRFRCPECDKEFIFPNNLGHHRIIVHGVNHSKRFKCYHCPSISASVLSYMDHMERHWGKKCGTAAKHVCSDCGKSCTNRGDLIQHVALIHDKVAGPD